MLILNSYVLAGGDRLANLVQWFAMVGSLIGVSLLAGQLGAARPGQWLAVAYAATLPMGIIQASSTMTDYLVGIWVLAAAIEALAVWRDRLPVTQASLYFGLAAGLGALTKPTGYAYIAPLAALAILGLWRQYGGWQAARALVLIGLVSLSLNFGQFLRNFLTYDNVLGPSSRIEQHGNQILGGRGLISNLIRNAGLHAGTPSPHVNKALTLSVMKVHELMGLDLNDPRTTAVGQFRIRKPTTNEDWAGNPLHAWLAVPVLGLVFTRRRDRLLSIFTGAVLLTFVLFSLTFKWQVFGSRLHLPFFLLLSPIVGSVAESLNRPKLAVGLVGVLSLASLPWLVGTDPRPLLPIGDQGSLGSVLTTPRRRLYFANASYLEVPYTEMAAQIRNSGCIDVALSLTGGTVEYPLWVLLGAPDQDLRIEWIVSGTDSEKHRDLQFQPCAVICQYCQGQAPYGDLLQTYERGEFRVYQGAYSGE